LSGAYGPILLLSNSPRSPGILHSRGDILETAKHQWESPWPPLGIQCHPSVCSVVFHSCPVVRVSSSVLQTCGLISSAFDPRSKRSSNPSWCVKIEHLNAAVVALFQREQFGESFSRAAPIRTLEDVHGDGILALPSCCCVCADRSRCAAITSGRPAVSLESRYDIGRLGGDRNEPESLRKVSRRRWRGQELGGNRSETKGPQFGATAAPHSFHDSVA
jgi:hypothetical protein